jgi:hypothetical protein
MSVFLAPTPKVTTTEATKNGGAPGLGSFALKGVKYFFDFIRWHNHLKLLRQGMPCLYGLKYQKLFKK